MKMSWYIEDVANGNGPVVVSWACYIHMQEDETGQLRGILVNDVMSAWHTYMKWLYMIGSIFCPTKVYFSLATLAGDSRYFATFLKNE